MQNNADIMYAFFTAQGWTVNAIAAMFGNMQTESTLNPGIWENLDPFVGGYGLVQWTPYTHYSEWAGDGWQDNGQKEMERIQYELENHLQWISTSLYPMTFREFSQSDKPPAYLAQAFLYNYERPAVKPQPARSRQAEYWYEYLAGRPPAKLFPIWLLFKLKERR
jgi:hypothetical protein